MLLASTEAKSGCKLAMSGYRPVTSDCRLEKWDYTPAMLGCTPVTLANRQVMLGYKLAMLESTAAK
jgi:hypothetical protein